MSTTTPVTTTQKNTGFQEIPFQDVKKLTDVPGDLPGSPIGTKMLPDDVVHTIAQSCLQGAGVRQMMKFRSVSKDFRRSVDRHVLRMMQDELSGNPFNHKHLDADVLQLQGCARVQCAKNRAVHWIALACTSFAREGCSDKQYVRSFMYTLALHCGGKGSRWGVFENITKALSQDEEHQAAGLQLVEMATSRLATVMPGFSEEEIKEDPRLGLQVEVFQEAIICIMTKQVRFSSHSSGAALVRVPLKGPCAFQASYPHAIFTDVNEGL